MHTHMFIFPFHNDSLSELFILKSELLMISTIPILHCQSKSDLCTKQKITREVSIKDKESVNEGDKEKPQSDRQKRREDEQSQGSTLTY